MKKAFYILISIMLISSCNSLKKNFSLPVESKQMLLVLTDSETSRKGTMFLYERTAKTWQELAISIPVCVGKNGLAWGKGLHQEEIIDGFPVKNEGDGKSPAGIFGIRAVFGYAPNVDGLKMPYIPVSEITECVDDVNSQHYNQVVNKTELEKAGKFDWNSSEKMRFMGEVYEIGAIVEHNMDPVKNGYGSCIFLHIWSGADSYTAGCTSMSPENMKRLAGWLDKSKKPVMVQLTTSLYQELKHKWGLPEVKSGI